MSTEGFNFLSKFHPGLQFANKKTGEKSTCLKFNDLGIEKQLQSGSKGEPIGSVLVEEWYHSPSGIGFPK